MIENTEGLQHLMESPPGETIDLLAAFSRPAWQQRALCRGQGVDDFFPDQAVPVARTIAKCHVCPVIQDCLQYAMDRPALTGIWGGTSDRARKRVRRQAKKRLRLL